LFTFTEDFYKIPSAKIPLAFSKKVMYNFNIQNKFKAGIVL